jgi:exodeoxyribonuclease V alpha subunit
MTALETLRRAGWLSALDCQFARSMARLGGEDDEAVLLAVAFASQQVSGGQVCLDLAAPPEAPVSLLEAGQETPTIDWPEPDGWRSALASSPLVESAAAAAAQAPEAGAQTPPLVLDAAGRLYLRRYWEHQERLAAALRARAEDALGADELDEAELERDLDRLFPGNGEAGIGPDLQRAAAECALRQRLCVISGGPGTGKTSTVARILVLLVLQAAALGRPTPRITLAAPTGKAAANLAESIRVNLARIEVAPEVRDAVPSHSATIHRVLGSIGGGRRFRHDARNPLATDLLLVDEASMVDLALMERLCGALPGPARLILLGDRDQLASVEAGAVLGDICNVGGAERGAEAALEEQQASGPLEGRVVQLRHSYRYDAASGIGALARAINEGDAEAALALLEGDLHEDVRLETPPLSGRLAGALADEVRSGYAPYLDAADPPARLEAMDRFRVLAAHRKGPLGVEDLNRQIEAVLAATGRIQPAPGLYEGRPVMMMRNDYELELYNGDVGLIARPPEQREGALRALFPASGAAPRWVSPLRLRAIDTVFAMSVHKSQGSEFDAVAIVLPDRVSPVVTRELVYTAVSRARRRVTLYASPEILRAALARRVERPSGLREALWGAGSPG